MKEGTIKKVWNKHKGKLIVGGATLLGLTVLAITADKGEVKALAITDGQEEPKEVDYGKDLEMHFVDPENGDVLWKERCTESYMDGFKADGMQYEETRKLNGIDEA